MKLNCTVNFNKIEILPTKQATRDTKQQRVLFQVIFRVDHKAVKRNLRFTWFFFSLRVFKCLMRMRTLRVAGWLSPSAWVLTLLLEPFVEEADSAGHECSPCNRAKLFEASCFRRFSMVLFVSALWYTLCSLLPYCYFNFYICMLYFFSIGIEMQPLQGRRLPQDDFCPPQH